MAKSGGFKLSTKVISLPVASALLMALILVFILPYMGQRLMDEKELKTRHLVESAASLIERYAAMEGTGALTRQEAQARAKEAIKALRYEKNDYFWINDLAPAMIMHPIKPALDGKDLSGFKDPEGKRLFVEMAQVAKAKGAGFVSYLWPKPGAKAPQPKISYVQLVPTWGWIVGSGIYVDDVAAEKTQLYYWVGGIGVGVLILVLLASWWLGRSISKPLVEASATMGEGVGEINAASTSLSDSAQALAEGSSEQAASLEETSASLEELTSMTKRNAESSKEADELVGETGRSVKRAVKSMEEMTKSMAGIDSASQEIGRIMKTIDEIAFQTNLLALNAAVEAARAGEHGAGFAVVADEVRSLAQRAADAAKDTQDLIERTIAEVKTGSQVVERTGEEFSEVARHAGQVAQLVAEIAASTVEQSQGLDQISRAVTEMDKVTQSTAASSQEAAAAAEQLSAQAEVLGGVANNLVNIVGVSASSGRGLRSLAGHEPLLLPES